MSVTASQICQALLRRIAQRIVLLRRPCRVAIDGVDGVGKTTFADFLAVSVTALGRPSVRVSVDGFLNPRQRRYRLGRNSPEGFYLDTYDYSALRKYVLDPFGPGGSLAYRVAAFDHTADAVVDAPRQEASPDSVLVIDGMFMHRAGLRGCWDLSIYLDAPFKTTVPRGAARGPAYGSPDPDADSNRRYVGGQQIYFATDQPTDRATIVIDYAEWSAPKVTTWR